MEQKAKRVGKFNIIDIIAVLLILAVVVFAGYKLMNRGSGSAAEVEKVKITYVVRVENVAKEPHIVDLANFLNSIGADVIGAGTSEIIINGVKQENLHPIEYTTIPDRIEAGTFMTAIIATKGKGIIRNVFPGHLTFFTDKLIKMGASVKLIEPNALEVSARSRLNAINIVTQPYPGFPTDLQAIAMAILITANGVSIINESL